MDFETSLEQLPGVGKYYFSKLEKLGLKKIKDLLFYFPARYEDFSNFKNIGDLEPGETATVLGKIARISKSRSWKRKINITEIEVWDETGAVLAVWFGALAAQGLKTGDQISLSGKIAENKKGFYFSNPFFEKNSENDFSKRETGGLIPIYPETRGITSRFLRFLVKFSLEKSIFPLDSVPPEILKKYNFSSLENSLKNIHFPENIKSAEKARKRFSFEKIFFLQLSLAQKKEENKKRKSFPIKFSLVDLKKFADSLGFKLTAGQKKSIFEILKDMGRSYPMNRLLQGDVGSGKTIIAAISSLAAAKAGLQTAILAPTEILARQHFQNFSRDFKDFNICVGLITSKEAEISVLGQRAKITKKELKNKISSSEIKIIVGTHALIQKNISFAELGLAIVDEQHRFGVKQRASLLKGTKERVFPHFLSMTATPIPRSLSLTLWGDLDISLLEDKPEKRKPIITKIVASQNRGQAYQFIRWEIKKGRQGFIVCPLIEASEKIQAKNVLSEYEKLQKKVFPDLKLALLHGKIKPEEKEKIMADFKSGRIDILVSTAVIEVGVDIPNATIMVIEGAERFGLAQIYQFRGRVGRGEKRSFCFIFTDSGSQNTLQRLKALEKAQSCFELAEIDLKTRGPGQFLGNKQSGMPDYAMEALKDISLVQMAKKSAEDILKDDSELKKHPLLRLGTEEFQEIEGKLN